jgi:hypothetical protein
MMGGRMKLLCAALALVWSVVFAVAHVYWAAGGRIGIGDSPAATRAMTTAWFLVYDIVAGVLCIAGAFISVLLSYPRLGDKWCGRLRLLAWTACVILILRGGIGIAQSLDPWFLLGGILSGCLAASAKRGFYRNRPIDFPGI